MDAFPVGTSGPNQQESHRQHKYSGVNIHRRLSVKHHRNTPIRGFFGRLCNLGEEAGVLRGVRKFLTAPRPAESRKYYITDSEILCLIASLGDTLVLGRSEANSKEIKVSDSQTMKITQRAYQLWQQAGEPKDRDDEFYLQARRELDEASENAITTTSPPASPHGRL
jgi:hypothetical protein